jgi:uncharacterized caspase-like protein
MPAHSKAVAPLFLLLCLFSVSAPKSAAADLPALNTAPRLALIIGNGTYSDVPLRNAPNDAKAMADYLARMGFQITLKVDATRADMMTSIRSFAEMLETQKAVGLFYFAGHGAQLAWRNYLIPVDAHIKDVADMETQAVDLGGLLKSMTQAKNPMNVVILDACRDNPFGKNVALPQKGLSQVDAPSGTFLAYATAPGNTAADGLGANGLYTENLLKEIEVPGAKIEDIFKRVRLRVRLQSSGRQIPWESTSLEQDFYFRPPEAVRNPSLSEAEQQFQEELALWERIQESKDPRPLEDYLRRYPSGKFSELAQFRLDRVLAHSGEQTVKVEGQAGNPYTKGTIKANSEFALGDSYTYRKVDLLTNAEKPYTLTITEITDHTVVYNKGRVVRDLLGNVYKNIAYGEYTGAEGGAAQFYPAEYSIGKRWTARYHVKGKDKEWSTEYVFKVVDKEKITLPAGEFDAFRVEGEGYNTLGARLRFTYWAAPDKVRRPLATEFVVAGSKTRKTYVNERFELTAYRQLKEVR